MAEVLSSSRRRSKEQERPLTPVSWDERLHFAIDVCLAGLIFVAPLFMGGRNPLGKLVFVGLVGVTASLWLLRQSCRNQARWQWSGWEWIFACGLGLFLIQLMPMSTQWVSRLSPAINEIIPVITNGDLSVIGIDGWHQVSLNPAATVQSLTVFGAFVLLFYIVFQHIEQASDVKRMLKMIAGGIIFMAVVALAQRLFTNGRFLWIYQNPQRSTAGIVRGTFFNQNHFAHCLAIGMGPLLWWLAITWRRVTSIGSGSSRSSDRQAAITLATVLTMGLGVVLLAGLLTISRGGIAALLVSMLVSLIALAYLGLVSRRAIFLAIGIVAVLTPAVFLYGVDQLGDRFSKLAAAESLDDVSRDRAEVYRASTLAAQKFAVVGSGGGSFSGVYPIFLKRHIRNVMEYAESGYMHLVVEFGVPGLVLALALIAGGHWCCVQLLRARHNRDYQELGAAAMGAAVASSLHSLVEFDWYIPACMTLTICLAAMVCRFSWFARETAKVTDQPEAKRERTLSRATWATLTTGCCVLTVLAIQVRVPPMRAQAAFEQFQRLDFHIDRHIRPVQDTFSDTRTQQVRLLRQVVELDPAHLAAKIHLLALLNMKFNHEQEKTNAPFGIRHIRETALDAFQDQATQKAWLQKVVSDEQLQRLHQILSLARDAIRVSPLTGHAYLFVSRVKFLVEPGQRDIAKLVNQATILRPTSGATRMNTMQEFGLRNDLRMYDMAATIFRENTRHSSSVAWILLQPHRQVQDKNVRIGRLMSIIRQVKPDRAGVRILFRTARHLKLVPETHWLGGVYIKALVDEVNSGEAAEPLRHWTKACEIAIEVQRVDLGLECSKKLLALDADSYLGHRTAALALTGMGRDREAQVEIDWCRKARPFDDQLMKAVRFFRQQLIQARQQRRQQHR